MALRAGFGPWSRVPVSGYDCLPAIRARKPGNGEPRMQAGIRAKGPVSGDASAGNVLRAQSGLPESVLDQ